ncbi:hypothetical protein [Calidifontibacillus erzurumensis]|uniref:hypothetical protein n=1 Tax=Calidifontibacillus erzurumensis TaxID=2741433 RepID=UPI0035B56EE2
MNALKNRCILAILILLVLYSGLGNMSANVYANDSDDLKHTLYPERSDWYPINTNVANVSHYIYNDINKNGEYDTEDQPIVNIAVKMTRPDNSYIIRRSNLNGFVNFTNSMIASPVDVSDPGEYIFEVIPPPGWEITSNNAIQKINYKEAPGTRPGIIADKVPTPTGISPIRKINGKIATRGENGSITNVDPKNIKVTAISPSGKEHVIALNEDGSFSVTGDEGIWEIRVKSLSNEEVYQRKVKLGHVPVQMSTIVLGNINENKAAPKNTKVVTFEDITKSEIQKVPNGVAGLKWTNLIITDNKLYSGEGYINNTISGRYVAYNTSGYPVTISDDKGFNFHGAYFGVAWFNEAEGEILKIRAWKGDKLIAEDQFKLSALGPKWFDANYYGITKLELETEHYWQFVVDDIMVSH